MQTFLLLLALLQLAAAFARARTLPPTDLIEVRLITPLSTYRTKTGDPVEAAVASPLCDPGGRLFPEGTTVAGVAAHVHKVGLGFVCETAMLELTFREFRLPDGRSYPVTARVVAVDNARERVDARGRIRGIRATGTISNRLGSRLALASFGHPYMFVPMFMVYAGRRRARARIPKIPQHVRETAPPADLGAHGAMGRAARLGFGRNAGYRHRASPCGPWGSRTRSKTT